ncbi:MAG: hypothetical protein KHX31_06690 [Akkermansia sp.]|uniref:hypothetical protein n=1 Tax=Akkermansia sp. TaxID=1872421 RepID=UPI0025C551CB|nr:hypothetical protein [Akkermansia sp.]MBS5508305.1 hypothetical protein [Akkermansia sp.]
MTPAVINFDLARGTDYDVVLLVQDAAAVPLDLTGAVLDLTLKAGDAAVPLAAEMVDAAGGHVRVRVPGLGLGMYPWECWLQASPDTPRERIIRGLVTVSDKVDPRADGNPSTHRYIVRMSDAVTVTVDSVDLAWWAYEQTRLLLGVDYASLAAQAAATAQRAETAAHTSSVNAAAYATEALRHKDAAGLSAAGAATSERNAGTSAQAAASAARTASDAQAAAAEDAQEVRRLLDGFDLEPGTVDAIPYGGTPSVSIVSGPTPGSHKLNFVLVTGPQGGKGDPGTLAANAGDLDLGGHLTATGGTFSGAVNANGGINIPLTAGAPTNTAAVSRAYALGLAQAAMMHQTRTYWITSSCTATNGVQINHIAPGCYCEAILAANIRTSVKLPSAGALGGGNYSKVAGYSLPIKFSGGNEGSAFKLSMLIGGSGQFDEYPDAGIDGFRFCPRAGSVPDITRLIDVTLYYDNGYKARVRELIGIGNPKRWVVRTTLSNLDYNSNTNPCSATYRIVIAQSEIGHGDALAAGVWLMMGGLSNDTIIKLADIRCWDTYHVLYAPVIYLDAQAGLYGGFISAESPTIINGVGSNTYVRYGLEPYQRSWITNVTEEPYTEPEQPTA